MIEIQPTRNPKVNSKKFDGDPFAFADEPFADDKQKLELQHSQVQGDTQPTPNYATQEKGLYYCTSVTLVIVVEY